MDTPLKYHMKFGTNPHEKVNTLNRYEFSTPTKSKSTENVFNSFLWKKKKTQQNKYFNSVTERQVSQSQISLKLDLFELINPNDENWKCLQEALTNSLLNKPISNWDKVFQSARYLESQSIANSVVEYYETQLLPNTMRKFQSQFETIEDILSIWRNMYRSSLPNVVLIFSQFRVNQDSVERSTLFEFKRRLTKNDRLKSQIQEIVKESYPYCRKLEEMLLVLHGTRKLEDFISDVDVLFEQMVSQFISPLFGYQGNYIDGVFQKSVNIPPSVPRKLLLDSVPRKHFTKDRKSIKDVFPESTNLWDISGQF